MNRLTSASSLVVEVHAWTQPASAEGGQNDLSSFLRLLGEVDSKCIGDDLAQGATLAGCAFLGAS